MCIFMTHSLSLYICVQAVFEKYVIRQIGSTNLFCMIFSCQNTLYGFTFLDGWNRRYWTYACCFQNMRYNFYWIIIFSECCFVFFVYLHVFFCFREQQNRKKTEHLLCFACNAWENLSQLRLRKTGSLRKPLQSRWVQNDVCGQAWVDNTGTIHHCP